MTRPTQASKTWLGSARVGRILSSWGTQLTVTENELVLRAPFFGTYKFAPEDVECLQPIKLVSSLGSGFRIHHGVSTYPRILDFVFFSMRKSSVHIREIQQFGFVPGQDLNTPAVWLKEDRIVGTVALLGTAAIIIIVMIRVLGAVGVLR